MTRSEPMVVRSRRVTGSKSDRAYEMERTRHGGTVADEGSIKIISPQAGPMKQFTKAPSNGLEFVSRSIFL